MSDLLAALRHHGTALIHSLDETTQARRIPACPDWDLRALVAHTAGAQHWVTTVVSNRPQHQDRILPEAPAPLDELIAWSHEALDLVLDTLGRTPEAEPVWHVAGGTVGSWWWRRKVAVETALHRWDAEPVSLEPALAVAGIEEHAGDLLPGLLRRHRDRRPHGTVRLVAIDAGRTFLLDLGGGPAELTVTGTASDLLLWLWNRPAPEIRLTGDPTIPELWKELSI